MTLSRFNLVLIGLLALQVVFLLIIGRPAGTSATAASAGQMSDLYPELKLSDLSAFEIAARPADKNAKPERIEVRKGVGGWQLASADGYPVKADKVDSLLQVLDGLHRAHLLATSATSHDELDIGDQTYQKLVTLKGAGDRALARFYVGRFAVGAAYVRPVNESNVYEVDSKLNAQLDTADSGWIDTELVRFAADDAKQVRLTYKGTAVVLEKQDSGWQIKLPAADAGPADTEKVMDMVRSLAMVNLTRPVAAQAKPLHGLEQPLIDAQVTLADGKVEGLTIGAPEPADKPSPSAPPPATAAAPDAGIVGATNPATPQSEEYFARKQGSAFVVTVPRYKVESLQKTAADFKAAKPPAADAGATPGPDAGATPGPDAGATGTPAAPANADDDPSGTAP